MGAVPISGISGKWEREERTHDELWQKCYDLYNKTGDPKYIEMMKAIEAGSK